MRIASAGPAFAVLGLLAAGQPALGQSQSDRSIYEPQYRAAYENLGRELKALEELQKQLESETDLVRGCGTLDQSLDHLKRADRLLADIERFTDILRLRRDNEAAKKQRANVAEDIKLKEGDIARMCTNLPQGS